MIVFLLLCVLPLHTGCAKQGDSFLKEAAADSGAAMAEEATGTPVPTPEPAVIYVDVAGAVKAPGVYPLEEHSRVFQAIQAAGGPLPDAELSALNRAQVLRDGEQVYVPSRQETAQTGTAATLAGGGAGSLVNLNTADITALCTLTGIGESKARAIIKYREKQGDFTAIEDLMKVPGIKEATFEKIKDEITV